MEIRARYIQIGVFMLFVLIAAFAFVYWLNNAGALRDRTVYRVLFEGSVSGLQRGSACTGLDCGSGQGFRPGSRDLLVRTAQAVNEPSAPRAVAPKRSRGG